MLQALLFEDVIKTYPYATKLQTLQALKDATITQIWSLSEGLYR